MLVRCTWVRLVPGPTVVTSSFESAQRQHSEVACSFAGSERDLPVGPQQADGCQRFWGGEQRVSARVVTAILEARSCGVARCEGPIIGAINGHAITGGFELALACDVLIASPNARFADTHARVGILPGWGLSQLLPRRIGTSRAKEISLTGNPIDAEQALAWGLVNRVVPAEELLATCEALAKDMLSCMPDALLGVKRLIDEGSRMNLGDALAYELEEAVASAQAMAAESVEERRKGILERNRSRS